ncbi:hypothetical protein Lal_00027200 [Lupinus albus]|nr:hypothetical protein Lal_00027200 [Lupinus albus]
MSYTDAQKVAYATFMLVKEAENWWEIVRRQMETEGQIITWEAFRKLEGKEEDVRVRDTAAGKVNSSRDYGPQSNPMPGRGKEKSLKMFDSTVSRLGEP